MIGHFFHRLAGFLIGTNLYIALVATALAAPGIVVFNRSYAWINLCFVFLSTIVAYNLQRYFKWRTGNMPVFLTRYAFGQTTWLLLIIPPALACVVLFVFMRPFHQWLLVAITGITGLYLFIHPSSKKLSGLRFIPFAKTLVVAFCWTCLFLVVCIPPGLYTFFTLTWTYWLLVFIQVWQSCVLFDLRDIETDREHGVKTFANVLSRDKLFVLWLVMSVCIITLSCYPANPNYVYAMALYGLSFGLQLACLFKPRMNGIMFTFLLDGSLVPCAAANFLLLS